MRKISMNTIVHTACNSYFDSLHVFGTITVVLVLQVKGFKDYIELYLKDRTDDAGAPLKVVHEQANERWEVAVSMSDKGFQQVSFVNSIATTKVSVQFFFFSFLFQFSHENTDF